MQCKNHIFQKYFSIYCWKSKIIYSTYLTLEFNHISIFFKLTSTSYFYFLKYSYNSKELGYSGMYSYYAKRGRECEKPPLSSQREPANKNKERTYLGTLTYSTCNENDNL